MTDPEWKEFHDAVQALHSSRERDPLGRGTVFEGFAREHAEQEAQGHRGQYFLPWHANFLFEFEAELQRVSGNPKLSVPYWDWSLEHDSWTKSDIWSRVGGAINGHPLPGGFFNRWSTTVPDNHFIVRRFNVGENVHTRLLETKANIDRLVSLGGRIPFPDFSWYLESAHGAPHIAVGGDMEDGRYSPNDPLFYLHHAFVDKIWNDWQKAGGGKEFFGFHQPLDGRGGRDVPVTTSQMLYPSRWGRRVSQVFTEIQPCVSYQQPKNRRRRRASRFLKQSRFGDSVLASVEHAARNRPAGNASNVLNMLTKSVKATEEDAVVNKIINPLGYQKSVLHTAVEQRFLSTCALKFSRIPQEYVQKFATMRKYVVTVTQKILTKDVSEPIPVISKTSRDLVRQGLKELRDLDEKGTISTGEELDTKGRIYVGEEPNALDEATN